jgi:hypothetical protein
MKYQIILLLALCVLMSSCKKVTNVKLIASEAAGKLSYQLSDDAGKGLAGVKVSVYDIEPNNNTGIPNSNTLVGTILTDQQGIAYFSELLPKNYLVTTDSVTVNKVKYLTDEFVQVVAGMEKKKVTKVSEFSGLLNITLISNSDYRTPLKNLGVVAYPINAGQPNSINIRSFINDAVLKGVTDVNGFVSIKVPSNVNFDFIVYNLTNNNLGYGYGNYRVVKGGNTTVSLYSYPF